MSTIPSSITLSDGYTCFYHVANQENFTRKRKIIEEGGPDQLILISDFDRTITTGFTIGIVNIL